MSTQGLEVLENTTSQMVRPFLKWAGGKRQIEEVLLRCAPSHFGGYFEPFLGGGALFFALYRQGRLKGKRVVLSDVNRDLIFAWTGVRDHIEEIIVLLNTHRYEKEYYYQVRSLAPETLSLPERAARTIYLNRTCFNGLYRVNAKGHFNVPMGRYTNPRICDAENLREASKALQGTELREQAFHAGKDAIQSGDFVYFDPPYVPLSATALFTGYSKEGFTLEDQEQLGRYFRELAARGVYGLLSNSDTPWVRACYQGFPLEEVQVRRSVNSRKDRRGPIGEVIVKSHHSPGGRGGRTTG